MRVRRHVVEAGPGACDADAGGARIAVRQRAPASPRRAPRRPGRRSPQRSVGSPIASAEPAVDPAEVESGLRLDDHRQVLRQGLDPARVGELPDERPNRKVDLVPEAMPATRRRRRPRARPRPAPARPCTRGAGRPGSSPRRPVLGHAGRVGDAVLPADHRPRTSSARSPWTKPGIDVLDGHAELSLEPDALLELRDARLGRRQEQIADLLEERRRRARRRSARSPAPAAPLAPSRTAAGRRPSPCRSRRTRRCPCRRG